MTNNDTSLSSTTEALPPAVSMRTTGYFFGGMSFFPGRNCAEVGIGDPGIPGFVAVKVLYSGTNKKPSIFIVPQMAMVLEQEEMAILLPDTPKLVIPA